MKITSEQLVELERQCGEGCSAWIEVLPGALAIGVERADGMKSAVQEFDREQLHTIEDLTPEHWSRIIARLRSALHAEDLPHN